MSISNCSSCGGDSRAAAITGIVTRPNATTGQAELAKVRPNGQAELPPKESPLTAGASLSSQVLGALLAFTQAA